MHIITKEMNEILFVVLTTLKNEKNIYNNIFLETCPSSGLSGDLFRTSCR